MTYRYRAKRRQSPRRPEKRIRLREALNLLRSRGDARLVQTNTRAGAQFRVTPGGGRLKPQYAAAIIKQQDISPADAGLFSGVPQSWRWGR